MAPGVPDSTTGMYILRPRVSLDPDDTGFVKKPSFSVIPSILSLLHVEVF